LFSLKKIVAEITKHLKKATRREVVLAGSVAKGTFLAGEGDIDLFILFKEKRTKEEMKKELEQIFKKAFPKLKYQMNYAEHPYIRFHYEGKKIDLVPAYKLSIGEKLLTAVDRSVLHTKYILGNLHKGQKDDVLLLKKFLKANDLYGAEIRTEGFSGYLCELLIIKYGSFSKLLKTAAKWNLPIVIDSKVYYKKFEYEGLVKRFDRYLVVIDPTDKNRNVAAPVSSANLKRFMQLARKFAKRPSEKYFTKQQDFEGKLRQLKKKYTISSITFQKPDIVDDILWGQIKRFMRTIENSLSDFEIKEVMADIVQDNQVKIAIIAKKNEIGGFVEMQGPPLGMTEHVENFKKKHKGEKISKKNGKIVAYVRTKTKTLNEATTQLVSECKDRFSHLPFSKATLG
jgi:tRNA nucleotidyltransferase (CCA-adding enzyme)